MTNTTTIEHRWLIKRDMPEVLDIDSLSFAAPWCDGDFHRCLRETHRIGGIAEIDGRIVGYMIYELQRAHLDVLRLAVDPAYRRQGVGRSMLERLRGKLSHGKRHAVWLDVPEENLGAQLWLRACGVRCVNVVGGDVYRFVMGVEW